LKDERPLESCKSERHKKKMLAMFTGRQAGRKVDRGCVCLPPVRRTHQKVRSVCRLRCRAIVVAVVIVVFVVVGIGVLGRDRQRDVESRTGPRQRVKNCSWLSAYQFVCLQIFIYEYPLDA